MPMGWTMRSAFSVIAQHASPVARDSCQRSRRSLAWMNAGLGPGGRARRAADTGSIEAAVRASETEPLEIDRTFRGVSIVASPRAAGMIEGFGGRD